MSVSRRQQAHTVAATMLATAAEHAAAVAPEVTVTTHLYHDDNNAAKVWLGESARACTIVLGSRRRGATRFGCDGLRQDSRVGTSVLPSGSSTRVGRMIEEDARVVVGVDGREPSAAALAFAFDFASRRSLLLRAVLCWHRDPFAEMLWWPEPPAPAHVEAWLSEAIAGWRQKNPDVLVAATVVRDHPVDGLLAAATAQYLLVVGNRGQHALTGTLFWLGHPRRLLPLHMSGGGVQYPSDVFGSWLLGTTLLLILTEVFRRSLARPPAAPTAPR